MKPLFLLSIESNLRRVTRLGLIVILFSVTACEYTDNTEQSNTPDDASPVNASFKINDREITLVSGYSEVTETPNSVSKIITQVWDTPAFGDLNGNGQQDAALILINSSGGSGTNYYVAAALLEGNHYRGTAGVLLGDRIEPTGIEIADNRIRVTYLDRAINQPFSTPPSKPRELLLIYHPNSQQLAQVTQTFEGEADPDRMALHMKTCFWIKTSYNDDSIHTPRKIKTFSLTFEEDGSLLVATDCNTMREQYRTTNNHLIQFERIVSTRMFCKDSQEQAFLKMLESVHSFFFTSHGQLVLELKYDSGSMIFK